MEAAHLTTWLNIHYIHVKPKNTESKKIVPLLLLLGWPGSVREFYEIIPLLTKINAKSDYIFEVIAPSLPGYVWSQGASKRGLGPIQMSIVLRNLMLRIGHERFVIQGGDIGSIVGAYMAALSPQNVLAFHSNMCVSNHPISFMKNTISGLLPQFFIPKEYTDFYRPLGPLFAHIMEETGHMHIQSTKPDTIGTALTDNPVGLAVYLMEKFSAWTNIEYRKLTDGGLTKRYTLDALLDNVMLYYVTNSITTSQRLYAEFMSSEQVALQIDRVPVVVPSGCARFLHELWHLTDFSLKHRYTNLIHSTYNRDGGHFAAMEVPKILHADLIEFINKAFEPAASNGSHN